MLLLNICGFLLALQLFDIYYPLKTGFSKRHHMMICFVGTIVNVSKLKSNMVKMHNSGSDLEVQAPV